MEKTKQYIEDARKSLGYVGENGGEELSLAEILKKSDKTDIQPEKITEWEWVGGSGILWKYVNGTTKWCAEVWVPYGGDGLYTHTYFFDREPCENDTYIIHRIQSFLTMLEIDHPALTFHCWECGRKCHFCDILAKDIITRIDRYEDRFCGNCDDCE